MIRALIILVLLVPSLLLQARAHPPLTTACATTANTAQPADPVCPCCVVAQAAANAPGSALSDDCCCSAPANPAPVQPAPTPGSSRLTLDFTAIPDWAGTPMPIPAVAHAVVPDQSFRLTHRPADSVHALLCVWRT